MPIVLSIYATAHDTSHMDRTLSTFKAAGSTKALCMVSGPGGWHIDPVRFGMVCAQFRGRGITPIALAFPPVTAIMSQEIEHYIACRKLALGGQLDAEPKQVEKKLGGSPLMSHWAPAELARWKAADPTLSITSTVVELPHLGDLGASDLVLQAEQQTSMAKVAQKMAAGRKVTTGRVILALGDFDQPGDPRTLPEFLSDCEAAKPYAEETGEVAVWSAASMSAAEAEAARATFGL